MRSGLQHVLAVVNRWLLLIDIREATALRDQQLGVVLRETFTSQFLHAERLRRDRCVPNQNRVSLGQSGIGLLLVPVQRLLSMFSSIDTIIRLSQTIT